SSILLQFLRGACYRHRNAIRQRPCIWVVTIFAPPVTRSCPSNDSNARAIHGRSSGIRMKEANVSASERGSYVRLRHITAQVDSKFKGTLCYQRRLCRYFIGEVGWAHWDDVSPWNVLLITSIC